MKIQEHITSVTKSIERLRSYAISGDLQPQEAYALIKEAGIDDYLKSELSEVKDFAIENLQRNFLQGNEKTYKGNGYQYTVRGGSTRYYFTNVQEVKEKKSKAESTEEYKALKECESKYKTAFLMKQKNQIMVDEETGEVIDPSDVTVVYGPNSLTVKRVEVEAV